MHLHRVVGGGPCNARRQELGHAGFEIAPPRGILLSCGIISELARNHDLGCHHCDLVGDARKRGDRLAELHAARRIAERLLHRGLRHPIARAAVWMRAASKVAINCLKPRPSTPPSRFSALTAKPSKAISYSFMPR